MKRILITIAICFCAAPSSSQWKSRGFGPDYVKALCVNDTNLFIAVNYAVFRYAPWLPPYYVIFSDTGLSADEKLHVNSLASVGSNLFCSSTISEVFRSTNNGNNWFRTHSTGDGGGPICLASSDTVLYDASLDIYQSTNYGDSWIRMVAGTFTSLTASGDIVLAGLKTGVYVSSDAGQHWTPDPINQVVNAVAIKGTTLFAGLDYSNNAILRSTNMGATWDASLVAQLKVTAFALHGNAIFAGTNGGGVYLSTDTGRNWTAINTGLGNLNVTCLAVQDTLLWAGTTNDLFYRPLSELLPKSAVQAPVALRDTLAIYPNPSTGIVTILAGSTAIERVSVLSVLGVEVLDVPNPHEAEITLDLSQVPSGTYFIQIVTANGTVMRKIVGE